MTTDRLGWVAAFGLLVGLYVMTGIASQRGTVSDLRQARIDSLQVVADSLKNRAVEADTVLVHVTDTLRVVVERTREVARAASDSLYAMADTAEAIQLDLLTAAHAEEVGALEELAAANLTWGNTWRDYAKSLETVNAELAIANRLTLAMLRSEKRKGSFYRAGTILAAGALGAVVLLK